MATKEAVYLRVNKAYQSWKMIDDCKKEAIARSEPAGVINLITAKADAAWANLKALWVEWYNAV